MQYNELIDTLQNLINRKITQKELMDILGITSPTTMSGRAKRNSRFTTEEIRKIENFFNVDIFGYNQKLLNKSNNEDEFIDIPVRGDVYASMGSGITVYNEEQTGVYKISRELARDIGVSLSNTQMIFASGDSMTPTIEGGDSLLIDLSKREVYDGRIYCVRIEGQLYAKRLQKIPPYQIKVISDNKEKYDPFYVDFSKNLDYDFEIIGEIRWWGRVAR